jgi:4-carboxymuconolactone decarboxylase
MKTKPQSAVRESFGTFAPKLVDLTEDVLFGDVWERPQLSTAVNRAKALLLEKEGT